MSPDHRHHLFKGEESELHGVSRSALELFIYGYLREPGVQVYLMKASGDTRPVLAQLLKEAVAVFLVQEGQLSLRSIQDHAPSFVMLADLARALLPPFPENDPDARVIPDEVIPSRKFCVQLLAAYHLEMRQKYVQS